MSAFAPIATKLLELRQRTKWARNCLLHCGKLRAFSPAEQREVGHRPAGWRVISFPSRNRGRQPPWGAILDIDGWLRGIGLAKYGELFRANDIDGSLLRQLTGDDLRDIGVASLGHRKKLLEAIANIDAAPEIISPPPAPEAERRHLTVMFVDLVSSTAMR